MTHTDQIGRAIDLLHPPRRIISLVPSQTELLHDLGLEEEVVGITKFCIHPERWFRQKKRVGGTKTIKLEQVADLQPDLIIANKEENTREEIEALAKDYPVWISDVGDLKDALAMIRSVGRLVDRTEAAQQLAASIAAGFEELSAHRRDVSRPRAAYLIWRQPYLVAGGHTFINDMIARAGFINVFADRPRYPEIDLEALRVARPDTILLSSEPYPFREKHLAEFRQTCPGASVELVDGELFSWYGSRLLRSPAYFRILRGKSRNNGAGR